MFFYVFYSQMHVFYIYVYMYVNGVSMRVQARHRWMMDR